MKEGLYGMVLAIPISGLRGTGIAVLHDGRIYGGGDAMYFVGAYRVDGDQIEVQARTGVHAPDVLDRNFAQFDDAHIKVSGKMSDNSVQMDGQAHLLGGIRQVWLQVALRHLPDQMTALASPSG